MDKQEQEKKQSNTTNVDFILLVTEAVSKQTTAFDIVNRLYEKNKEIYYQCAKKSTRYDHPYLNEGTLMQVECAKKFLGIFEYCSINNTEQNVNVIFSIIKKAYQYAFTFVEKEQMKTNPKVILTEFAKAFSKKNKGVSNVSTDFLNGSMLIVVFLSICGSLEIDYADDYYTILVNHFIKQRDNLYIGFEKVVDKLKNEIQLFSKGKSKLSLQVLNDPLLLPENEFFYEDFSALFTRYRLSETSLFSATTFDKQILENIYIAYHCTEKYDGKLEFEQFLTPSIIICRLIKAYQEAKDYYFKNNKETLYIELGKLEKDNLRISGEYDNLLKEYNDLNLKHKKLLKEVYISKKEKEELSKLRELFFALDTDDELDNQVEVNNELTSAKEITKTLSIVFVGGHDSFILKIKDYFPKANFIRNETFDIKLLEKKDVFLIYKHLSHSIYYKVMRANYNNIFYLANNNINKCLLEIANIYQN